MLLLVCVIFLKTRYLGPYQVCLVLADDLDVILHYFRCIKSHYQTDLIIWQEIFYGRSIIRGLLLHTSIHKVSTYCLACSHDTSCHTPRQVGRHLNRGMRWSSCRRDQSDGAAYRHSQAAEHATEPAHSRIVIYLCSMS